MKYSKSELTYKFLVFLLLSILIIFVVAKIIWQFIQYKEDIELVKEKIQNLQIKDKGLFLNNLNYPIYAYINFNLIPDNLKMILPSFLENYMYISRYYEIKRDKPQTLIAFDILTDKEKDLDKLKDKVEVVKNYYENYKIYNNLGKYELLINCDKIKKGEKLNFQISYIPFNFQTFKKTIFYLYNGKKVKLISDLTLNLRIKKYKNTFLLTTEIAKPNELVYFLKDQELNIRFFYNPSDISEVEVKEFINNLKKNKNIKNIEIKKNYVKVNIFDNYYICLNSIYINLSNLNNIRIYLNNFVYVLTKEKKKEFLNIIRKKEIVDQTKKNKLFILKGKEIYIPLKNNIIKKLNLDYTLNLNYFGNKKINYFLTFIDNLKNQNNEKNQQIRENILYFMKQMKKKNYDISTLLKENYQILLKKYNKEEIINYLIYFNFLNPSLKYISLVKTLREPGFFVIFEEEILNNEEKKYKFLKLLKENINYLQENRDFNSKNTSELITFIKNNEKAKKIIEKNIEISKENPYFNLILMNEEDFKNLLKNENTEIYLTDEKVSKNNPFTPFLKGIIDYMEIDKNLLIIKVK